MVNFLAFWFILHQNLKAFVVIIISLLNLWSLWRTQFEKFDWYQCTHPWLNTQLSMISDFSSTSLKFISWQWCSFLNKNFLLLLLDVLVYNYHQFIVLLFKQRPFDRSGRSFKQRQHLCSIWWRTLGVSSKEIPYSTSCHWNDMLNMSFLLHRERNQ